MPPWFDKFERVFESSYMEDERTLNYRGEQYNYNNHSMPFGFACGGRFRKIDGYTYVLCYGSEPRFEGYSAFYDDRTQLSYLFKSAGDGWEYVQSLAGSRFGRDFSASSIVLDQAT